MNFLYLGVGITSARVVFYLRNKDQDRRIAAKARGVMGNGGLG